MTTDVSSALETLQLDPDNKQALSALASLHPGNGSGVDRAALAHALTDARRFHRERGDFELCVQLIDLELAWTIESPKRADLLHEKGRILSDELLRDREGQECVRLALEAVPDHAPVARIAVADEPGAEQLGVDLEALSAAGRGGDRSRAGLQPLPFGGRVSAQVRRRARRRRGGALPAQEPGAGSRATADRASTWNGCCATPASRTSCSICFERRAEQAPSKEDRAARRAGRGRAVGQAGAPRSGAGSLQEGARVEPGRAPRAARRDRRAQRAAELDRAVEDPRRRRALEARRAGRRAAGRARQLCCGSSWGRSRRPRPPSAACARSIRATGRWSTSIASTSPGGTRSRSWCRCWRRPRRPRPTSSARSRWGSRWHAPSSSARGAARARRARRTPRRPSTSGRACCACSRTCPRRSSRSSGSTRAPRSGTRCSSCSRRTSRRSPTARSTKRSVVTWTSSRSIEIA